jgi:sodium borate transporter 11
MFGTLWLALFLYNFRKTPYLTRSRREWLADYALPASVLIMSFLGAYTFSEIDSMWRAIGQSFEGIGL